MSIAEQAESQARSEIHVISDVMCPWCYVGKRHLETAIARNPDIAVTVAWHPFQLDPTLPPEGKDRRQYLNEKFGEGRAQQFYARIAEAGQAVGIPFAFDKIAVSPNTIDAHRLIRWAGGQGAEMQDRVVERLFSLYFVEGRNIGDHAVLAEAGTEAGLDGDLLSELLSRDVDVDAVRQDIEAVQRMGVNGVPFMIVNNRYAITGAQPPSQIAEAIRLSVAAPETTPQA